MVRTSPASRQIRGPSERGGGAEDANGEDPVRSSEGGGVRSGCGSVTAGRGLSSGPATAPSHWPGEAVGTLAHVGDMRTRSDKKWLAQIQARERLWSTMTSRRHRLALARAGRAGDGTAGTPGGGLASDSLRRGIRIKRSVARARRQTEGGSVLRHRGGNNGGANSGVGRRRATSRRAVWVPIADA